jgi:hypothetical protein
VNPGWVRLEAEVRCEAFIGLAPRRSTGNAETAHTSVNQPLISWNICWIRQTCASAAQLRSVSRKQKECIRSYLGLSCPKIAAMDLQHQHENEEAASLVSSFSLNVATQQPDNEIATALYEQERAERHERANQVPEERRWKGFYESNQTGRYVTLTIREAGYFSLTV